jgi:hypothetical protein
MNRRVSPRVSAGIETATALEEWEAEGGASAGLLQASEHDAWRPSPPERLLLERAVCDRAAGGCLEFRQRTVGGSSRPPGQHRDCVHDDPD